MAINLFIGCGTMVVCPTLQCFVVSLLVGVLLALEKRQFVRTHVTYSFAPSTSNNSHMCRQASLTLSGWPRQG
jgi:hypothetical protein